MGTVSNKPSRLGFCITRPSGDTIAVSVWWIILTAIAVGRAVQHHQTQSDPSAEGARSSAEDADPTVMLSVARGAGFALMVAFPAVYLTRLHLVAYCFWAWFRYIATSTVLHAHIGASILVAAVVHSVAHLAKPENGAEPLFEGSQLRT